MIDHVSLAVKDLDASGAFYEKVLAPLGYTKLVQRPGTIGFGKKYPEVWLNLRAGMPRLPHDLGAHVALRARSEADVREFHRRALALGATSDGDPGARQGAMTTYYGAFIVDRDGNKVEALSFPR